MMSLEEARRLVDTSNSATHLLELDDLWTNALRSDIGQVDRNAVIQIGTAMQALLKDLRAEVPWLRYVVLRDEGAFEEAAQHALEAAPLQEGHKDLIRYIFRDRGWAGEVLAALDELASADDVERELSEKIAHLSTGEDAVGDFKLSFRGTLKVIAAGAAVAVAVLTIPATATAGVTILIVGAPIMQLAADLPDLFERRHDSEIAQRMKGLEDAQRGLADRLNATERELKFAKDQSEIRKSELKESERKQEELRHELVALKQERLKEEARRHKVEIKGSGDPAPTPQRRSPPNDDDAKRRRDATSS